MLILGPFTAPSLGATDERQVSAQGLGVGVEIHNISGNLLRINIGSRQEWLPAYRVDRFPLPNGETTVFITNVQVEIPNATENQYLMAVAFTNDGPDYLSAFPGTYPADIERNAIAITQLVSGITGQPIGDLNASGLDPDGATTTYQMILAPLVSDSLVLASFKPAANAIIAPVGAPGPITVGTTTAVNPTFQQPTTAGDLLVCVVGSQAAEPATVSAGWVKATDLAAGGTWAAIWYKPNCGAAEAPPQFTAAGGGPDFMAAQLAEFSGVLAAAPLDQVSGVGSAAAAVTLTTSNPSDDIAFGDLAIACARFHTGQVDLHASGGLLLQLLNNHIATRTLGSQPPRFGPVGNQFGYIGAYGVVPSGAAVIISPPLGVQDWPYDFVGTVVQNGALASVVFAAVPGKAYTLAMLAGTLRVTTAVADAQELDILDGVNIIGKHILSCPGVANQQDRMGPVTNLAIKGTAGNSMTVKFANFAAASQYSILAGVYLR